MKHERPHNNLILVVVFAFLVLFLIGISLIIKFVGILQESAFDGEHRFTIVVSDNKNNLVFLSVDPSQKQTAKLIVHGASSLQEAMLKIPVAVDGVIIVSTDLDPRDSVVYLIQQALIKHNTRRVNLTFIDLIRMYISAKTARGNTTYSEEVSISQVERDILQELFFDTSLQNEDMAISIENASLKSGVGSRLETILTNMGANVISVETALEKSPRSKIVYFSKESYTSRKLHALLGYPLEVTDTIGIADISIIIGEDGLKNTVFQSIEE